MCQSCERKIAHLCLETGAVEMVRGGQGELSKHLPFDPPSYLDQNFASLPANADGPRRTDDMHGKDYVHHELHPYTEEELLSFQVFQVRDATEVIFAN